MCDQNRNLLWIVSRIHVCRFDCVCVCVRAIKERNTHTHTDTISKQKNGNDRNECNSLLFSLFFRINCTIRVYNPRSYYISWFDVLLYYEIAFLVWPSNRVKSDPTNKNKWAIQLSFRIHFCKSNQRQSLFDISY